ncbi:MAG: hypothetical protein L3J06_02810 [Cyclobacteriaceae bacterium]|nr:hypothetical protein [Cyclobacteriaceae bacterium]
MTFTSPEEFLDRLNQWFNSLIALPLLLVAYGYLEIFSGGITAMVEVSRYVVIFLVTTSLAYAILVTRLYKNEIKAIDKALALRLRLVSYYSISKVFFIRIFVVSLISVVGLYVTGSVAFAGFYAFLLFLLSIYRPALLNVANKLALKGEERTNFLKKNSFTIN